MNTTATTAARSECVSVINARDFSKSTADLFRDVWTVGKLYHLIKALDGRRVAVTADKSTGHTLFNVTLDSAYDGGNGPRLRVSYNHGGGVNVTDYRTGDIGMVMVMPTGEVEHVKWEAMQSYRDHCSAAIAITRERCEEFSGRKWGVWSAAVVDGDTVHVRYTPSTGNPAFADRWGKPGAWMVKIAG